MPLSSGLIHYYDCDQAAGNLIDRIGTLNMAGTTASTPVAGFIAPTQGPGRNGGADFALFGYDKVAGAAGDGFAFVADQADVRFASATPMTVGFWFYPSDDGAGNTAAHYLVADIRVNWFGSPSFQGAWAFYWANNNSGNYVVRFYVVYGTGQVAVIDTGSQFLTSHTDFLNHWHTVVTIYDGTTFSLYCDCVLAGTSTQAPAPYAPSNDNHLTIGGAWIVNPTAGPGQGSNALVDEVAFWNRVLVGPGMGTEMTAYCGGQSPLPPLGTPSNNAYSWIG